ncbi:hypothetical protein J6590_068279 [Homalodisca vitripennis]|nr:hypothetical protein J6590_068279 [Homalodisca vitripennis]
MVGGFEDLPSLGYVQFATLPPPTMWAYLDTANVEYPLRERHTAGGSGESGLFETRTPLVEHHTWPEVSKGSSLDPKMWIRKGEKTDGTRISLEQLRISIGKAVLESRSSAGRGFKQWRSSLARAPGIFTAYNTSPELKSQVRETQSHQPDESGILYPSGMDSNPRSVVLYLLKHEKSPKSCYSVKPSIVNDKLKTKNNDFVEDTAFRFRVLNPSRGFLKRILLAAQRCLCPLADKDIAPDGNCCYKLESEDPRLSFTQTGDQPDLDPFSSPDAGHITLKAVRGLVYALYQPREIQKASHKVSEMLRSGASESKMKKLFSVDMIFET